MKYLIVTADDLGVAKSINEGIAMAAREGIVTSVSVMPTGEAFDDALNIIKGLAFKGIGAHLALTETRPVLSDSVFFKNHNQLFINLSAGKINLDDVYKELKAQLEILRSAGLKICHINSHEHIHIIPKVLDIFIRLAKEYGIPAIRFPRGDRPPKILSIDEIYRSILLRYFAGRIRKDVETCGLAYTDFFMGLLDAGRFNVDKMKALAGILREGVTELVAHPGFLSPEVLERYGWHKNCETELFALTDKRVKNALNSNNIKLISFEEFLTLKK